MTRRALARSLAIATVVIVAACGGSTSSGGAKTKISQMVEVKGPLGPLLAGMMGPQVSKEFPTLLANLARKAEASA